MTGLVLVVGILITIFMVKETKIERNYVKTKDGELVRQKTMIAEDEDPDDSGDDIIEKIVAPVPETVEFIKGVTLSLWDQTKLLYRSTVNALKGDRMT